MTEIVPKNLVVVLGVLFGAMVGSFLNVCIYRLPRGISVAKPARSFCPGCEKTISWYHNIPLMSWLVLRGKCAGCSQCIPARYFVVEVLTSVFFGGIVWKFWGSSASLILPYFLFVSLLLVATFVDLEHMIIPDEVTWGGVLAGLVCALSVPSLHSVSGRLDSLLMAGIGALAGYGILWCVVEGGRLAFGRRKFTFTTSTEVVWTRSGDTAELIVDGESLDWSDLFPRGTESVVMEFEDAQVDGRGVSGSSAIWKFESLVIARQTFDLNQVVQFKARLNSLVLPREVMGYGDVKFLAAIGAFTGWKAVLFTLLSGSIAGAGLGIFGLLTGRREWSEKIPFGPYLALGALLWLVMGKELWGAYWALIYSGPGR